jgi:hypothetical protein
MSGERLCIVGLMSGKRRCRVSVRGDDACGEIEGQEDVREDERAERPEDDGVGGEDAPACVCEYGCGEERGDEKSRRTYQLDEVADGDLPVLPEWSDEHLGIRSG